MFVLFIILLVLLLYIGFVKNYVFYFTLQIEDGFFEVEPLLKQRFDLIPSVISVLKEKIDDKRKLEELILIHNKLYHKLNMEQRVEFDVKVDLIFKELLQLADQYNGLKFQSDYTQLLDDMEHLSNRIETSKKDYNQYVLAYQRFISMKPNCFVVLLMMLNKYHVL